MRVMPAAESELRNSNLLCDIMKKYVGLKVLGAIRNTEKLSSFCRRGEETSSVEC